MQLSFNIYNLQKRFLLSLILILLLVGLQASTNNNNETSSKTNIPDKELYTVILGGKTVGHLKVSRTVDTLISDFDYKDNGRGPSIKETIILNSEGFPINWDISGNSTFGNIIDEHFNLDGKNASWKDATGKGSATIEHPSLYLDQFGGPYSKFIAARIILNSSDLTVPALPSGELKLTEMETLNSSSATGEILLKSYALSGADLNPSYIILDEERRSFAYFTPRVIIIRSGFESDEKRIRQLAEKYAAERYENMQSQFAHKYESNIRIRNVKIFDPKTLALTELTSVLIGEEKIISIDATDVEGGENEIEIDGDGGTIVAGLYDMHGHMGENSALLNIAAGVTSVRDMGNNNEVLNNLIKKIESGILAGPHITRLGFIEGKSPYNSNNGILVENKQQALDAVSTYAEKGFYGIKLYNSMNGDWAPSIVKKAHELNMPITGHVPAFSNANDMIRAGFDELTHINQIMLGWVLEPDEDTRTLLRLTALQRLPALDLNSAPVKETLELMVKNNVALDPTLAIHELILLARNGEPQTGSLDYIKNMPANVQRGAKVGLASIANDKEDKAYKIAYEKIVKTLKLMKQKGILIIPGTDLGGALTLHRELELYQQLGYTPAELLKLGSYDMANYLGHKDRGEIKPGMLADFFLIPGDPTKDIKSIKTISMVSSCGVIYFPSEIYPEFGIKPFIKKPRVILADSK